MRRVLSACLYRQDPRLRFLIEVCRSITCRKKSLRRNFVRLDGTPGELLNHKELMDIVLPSLRADFALYESYRYFVRASTELPDFHFRRFERPKSQA